MPSGKNTFLILSARFLILALKMNSRRYRGQVTKNIDDAGFLQK